MEWLTRNFLRNHVKMAKVFEELVLENKRFEVVVSRNFALVCFRISPSAVSKAPSDDDDDGTVMINEVNCKLLEAINASGNVYMTHAVVGGIYVFRCAIGATLTEEKHILMAWKEVQGHADAILGMYQSF